MQHPHPLKDRKLDLRHKLFIYMLIPVIILLIVMLSLFSASGRFSDAEEELYDSFDMQMNIFSKDITSYCDNLATIQIPFSKKLSSEIDRYLSKEHISFSELSDSPSDIAAVQSAVFDPSLQYLRQAECTGAFVILDTTVNTGASGTEDSRSGIYLNSSGTSFHASDITLFRGNVSVAEDHDVYPHRKWQLEFDTSLFPGYQEMLDIAASSGKPVDSQYRFSQPFTLPRTSENVILMTIPVVGEDGTVYGICGFEINERYFKKFYAQPASLDHLICAVTVDSGSGPFIPLNNSFTCGVLGGFYSKPDEQVKTKHLSNDLIMYKGDTSSYVGISRQTRIAPGNSEATLFTIIPKSDYDHLIMINKLQILGFAVLVTLSAVFCCIYFTRRFIKPVLQDIEQIKTQDISVSSSNITEIEDLLAFLTEQKEHYDRKYEQLETQQRLAAEKSSLIEMEIRQLTGSRHSEMDPDTYKMYKDGLSTLTPKEKEVFDLYIGGYKPKDIIEKLGFSKNTLKYHNRNIYSKLGVSGRKELVQYNLMMQYEESSGDAQN